MCKFGRPGPRIDDAIRVSSFSVSPPYRNARCQKPVPMHIRTPVKGAKTLETESNIKLLYTQRDRSRCVKAGNVISHVPHHFGPLSTVH